MDIGTASLGLRYRHRRTGFSARRHFTPSRQHFGTIDDKALTAQGLSIADQAGNRHRGAKLRGNSESSRREQTIFDRRQVTEKGVFGVRLRSDGFRPDRLQPPDRNLIELISTGGPRLRCFVNGRHSIVRDAVAYMRISAPRNLARDTQFFSGLPAPCEA